MLSDNALTVLKKRYLRKDDDGKIVETPEMMFERVAKVLAEPDRLYGGTDADIEVTAKKFYDLTYNLDFLPNSPTLANAGGPLGNLSACFVLPVPDDLAGIFESIKNAALIHQTGGGTGFAFTRLRPKNDIVRSTKGVSSGPLSFMDVFNAATDVIKQGGMRRGANMGTLRVDHPDILDFIDHKEDLAKLTNFNISVAVTDEFMAAVEDGSNYALRHPQDGRVIGVLDAKTVFDKVVMRAWSTGEPGIVFIDRMNRECPVPWMGSYEATNPCGEQPLLPYESCNLGSINLERFVRQAFYNGTGHFENEIDWDRLRLAIHASVHLLDNVIDANVYPLPEIEAVTKATRKIGLGVMGFARLLFKLDVGYGSPESLELAGQIMSFLDYESKVASMELARARGRFPASLGHEEEASEVVRQWFVKRQDHPFRHEDADYAGLWPLVAIHGLRNSTTTTVAPTGTLSIIADTSGGCEPVFALAFKRWQADEHMLDVDSVFKTELEAHYSPTEVSQILEAVDQHHGSLAEALKDPKAFTSFLAVNQEVLLAVIAETFVTSHDITPTEHVNVQAAFQRFNDSATSKTINFPESATPDDVRTAYLRAWETGCKGITVYRNNSRKFQPLSTPTPALASDQAAATCCAHPTISMSEGCWTCTACGSSGCSL